ASGAHRADPLLDRGLHEAVVVLRDEAVDAALEQRAQDRVERLVRLAEVHARAAVAQVLETGPPRRPRPERLADGVVAPGFERVHLREPLPRPSDASGEQIAPDQEKTVAGPPLSTP